MAAISKLTRPEPLPAKTAYDLAGTFYDHRAWMEFWSKNEKPLVFGALGATHGRRILDIGCGTGFYALDLIERGNEVCGVDVSPVMIQQLESKVSRLPVSPSNSLWLIHGDGQRLPIKDDIFDACIVIRALSHIENYVAVFDELERILKNHGTLVIADLHSKHLYEDTKLEDPFSGRKIPVLTFKRPPHRYLEALKERGFEKQSYLEITYRQCKRRLDSQHSFAELEANPDNPIFFVGGFRKGTSDS